MAVNFILHVRYVAGGIDSSFGQVKSAIGVANVKDQAIESNSVVTFWACLFKMHALKSVILLTFRTLLRRVQTNFRIFFGPIRESNEVSKPE